MLRQKAFKGKHKIQDRWENATYEVLNQVDSKIPVYQVKVANGGGKIRTLHRNMLFPLVIRHQGEEIETPVLSEEKNTPEAADSDTETDGYWSADEQPASEGPMTRSRTKALATAKMSKVMSPNKSATDSSPWEMSKIWQIAKNKLASWW